MTKQLELNITISFKLLGSIQLYSFCLKVHFYLELNLIWVENKILVHSGFRSIRESTKYFASCKIKLVLIVLDEIFKVKRHLNMKNEELRFGKIAQGVLLQWHRFM